MIDHFDNDLFTPPVHFLLFPNSAVTPKSPKRPSHRSRDWIPVVAMTTALILAVGPCVLLVNRPTFLFGLPLIYAWGILWFLIMGGITLATNHWIWRQEAQDMNDTPAAACESAQDATPTSVETPNEH